MLNFLIYYNIYFFLNSIRLTSKFLHQPLIKSNFQTKTEICLQIFIQNLFQKLKNLKFFISELDLKNFLSSFEIYKLVNTEVLIFIF
jgi:hypothetical protein